MNPLLEIFRKISGLNTHHVAINFPDNSLEFDGVDPLGKRFHIKSEPTNGNFEAAAAALAEKAKDMTAVTGFSGVAATIREQLQQLKEANSQVQNDLVAALQDGQNVNQQAKAMVTQMKAEIADTRAALGLTSNGPDT